MKYFTPELLVRFQSEEYEISAQAEQSWEEAAERYNAQLRPLLPHAPRGLRQLFDNYYLHDADILTMGQHGPVFVIVMRLDPPYRDLVLSYTLAAEPSINRSALPEECCSPHLEWMYDEVELVSSEPSVWDHSILLSNGWELGLRFTDLQVTPFRCLVLGEAQQRRADESERLGAILAQELASPVAPQ